MHTPDIPLDTSLDIPLDVPLDSPDSSPDSGLDSVQASTLSAVEAARVAGVHGRTIRRAITEGQLVATMEGGAYRVSPAALAAWRATRTPKPTPDAGMDTTLDTGVDVQARVQDTVHQSTPGVADVIAAKDALVERLADEVADLRERLTAERDRAAEERRRFDILIHDHLQRIEVLTATTAQDAPGATEGVSEGDPSSWWARTWRRVRGGR